MPDAQETLSIRAGLLVVLVALLLICPVATAGDITTLRNKPDDWFTSEEGQQVLSNILSWQQPTGGWWKAYDVNEPRPQDKGPSHGGRSIFDNNATWSEMRLLARAYRLTGRPEYRKAFDRALAMMLDAQYDNGGFPQQVPPPRDNYARYITYNDAAMVQVLRLLRDIADGQGDFTFVDEVQRKEAAQAFEKGINCILATQIRVDGRPTVWCAQHDDQTLEPAPARIYEHASFSGGESAAIVLLLMEIEEPDERIKQTVQGAVAWYEQAKLTGIRTERRRDPDAVRGFDLIVVSDPDAEPLWARFYDLETGKPIFAGRDGVKKDSLAEIDEERRTGYAWLGTWGQKVLDAYPEWAKKHGERVDTPN